MKKSRERGKRREEEIGGFGGAELPQIENTIIPLRIEIPPIPIRLSQYQPETMIAIYGLPEGIIYDPTHLQIIGCPTRVGHYSILVILVGDKSAHLIFTMDVIDFGTIPIEMKKINNQTITLGQQVSPISLNLIDKTATVAVDGLPKGVEYDSYLEQITGIPEIPGEYRVTMIVSNKYGTQITSKFIITVDGLETPSLVAGVNVNVNVTDHDYHFHNLGDQVIYTFTIKNNGNIPLFNLQIDDLKFGRIALSPRINPEQETLSKHVYYLTQSDLDLGSISLHSMISGQTSTGVKAISIPLKILFTLRGHDHQIFNIRILRSKIDLKNNVVKYTFITVNQSEQEITRIHTPNANLNLDKDRLSPNEVLTGHFTVKLPNTGYKISLIGYVKEDIPVGNTFIGSTLSEDKRNTSVKLYHPREHDALTLIALVKCNHIPLPTGIVKFYDGVKCLGKSKLHQGKAHFKISSGSLMAGSHIVYALYQGDTTSFGNGSNLMTITERNEAISVRPDVSCVSVFATA